MGIDWDNVAESLKDINENLKYLRRYGGENQDEDNLRKTLINIDIENLKSELFRGKGK